MCARRNRARHAEIRAGRATLRQGPLFQSASSDSARNRRIPVVVFADNFIKILGINRFTLLSDITSDCAHSYDKCRGKRTSYARETTSFRVWLNERALSIQVGRSKSRTRQLSFVQQAAEIHIRRSRHVAAVRELSDRRSGRRHGAVLSAAYLG